MKTISVKHLFFFCPFVVIFHLMPKSVYAYYYIVAAATQIQIYIIYIQHQHFFRSYIRATIYSTAIYSSVVVVVVGDRYIPRYIHKAPTARSYIIFFCLIILSAAGHV